MNGSYDIGWAFPADCEYCRSPLLGSDIIAVLGPAAVDCYCSTCSKINHITKAKQAQKKEAASGAVGSTR